jgi:hypothetical protein
MTHPGPREAETVPIKITCVGSAAGSSATHPHDERVKCHPVLPRTVHLILKILDFGAA